MHGDAVPCHVGARRFFDGRLRAEGAPRHGQEKEAKAGSANRSVDHARRLWEAVDGVIWSDGSPASLHRKPGFLTIAYRCALESQGGSR
jgi:hypothetical protein